MIRIAFNISQFGLWMGGINYLKNLITAIKLAQHSDIEVILFAGHRSDQKIIDEFLSFGRIIRSSYFDSRTPASILWHQSKKILKTDIMLLPLAQKYNIQVFSHMNVTGIPGVKCINWIPDFQHLHLPDFFSKEDLETRNKNYAHLALESDATVVSSQDSYKDFRSIFPSYKPAYVLRFAVEMDLDNVLKLQNEPTEKFFFLPNQFWIHKNHTVVWDALSLLKKSGHDIKLICTGALEDHRGNAHIEKLKQRIINEQLPIELLGLVPRVKMLTLLRDSIAVINPSSFEGWSSSVEEAKALNKTIILSDIKVHREQAPEFAHFFKSNHPEDLAQILLNLWSRPKNETLDTQGLVMAMNNRLTHFGHEYLSMIKEVVG